MPQCAVATCRNSHRRTRGRRIRYHRFPQLPEVRSRWVRACGRAPLANGDIPFNIQTARICSLHFTNDSYEKDMQHLVLGLPVRSRLRRGAVPTIGVPVAVQPVTKLLVEDATRRSILKANQQAKLNKAGAKALAAAAAAAAGGGGGTNVVKKIKNNNNYHQDMVDSEYEKDQDYKTAKMDVLLAVGLTPTNRLNKMHAMDNSGGNVKKVESELKLEDDDSRKSPKVPQSQQNGAALPEETASADRNILRMPTLKREKDFSTTNAEDSQAIMTKSSKPQMNNQSTLMSKANRSTGQRGRPSLQSQMHLQQREEQQSAARESRKRRSAELLTSGSANGNSFASKRICLDQREQYINSLIGSDKITVEQLATKAEQLRSELQDLDELARAKEMEWNEILSLRKLKEEAFLRVERRRQVLGFMEGNGPLGHSESNLLPTSSLVLAQQGYEPRDRALLVPKEEQRAGSVSRDSSPALRRERASKTPTNFQQQAVGKLLENGPRHLIDAMSSDQRQIGEGRQGPIVDVRSIIADYRLRHPDTVPKRGRRMRNSVVANVGLGAGGAMVETLGHMDSRPSSADSCKSSSNMNDPNNSMSFKDVLVQFAKLSQQQGEPIKTPQNYPDVTLHPVAPTQTTQNSSPQTGSLLHGILTKSQSPRPTNFSPTLARLLTAPERERNTPAITANPHQSAQQLLQAYQSSNSVSISDFLCSSKARTEITITPVVNSQVQSQSGNLIQIDDQDDDNSIIEERESRLSVGTNREEKDPPRCQGCNERAAQFVCAGCGAQWYCSRECQVAAWDDHSDNCSG